MQKRLLSILLAFTIVLTLLPEKAIAAETSDYTEPLTEHLYYISNAGTGQETKTEILKEKAEGLSLSSGYAFEVVFSHPENIDKVYVTSTINNQTSYLEATAIDADRTTYRTRSYFNNDENYIPGTISIEYTKKIGIVPVTESWNSSWDNWGINGATVEKIDNGTSDGNTVTVAISNLLEGVSGPIIEATISSFEDNAGISGGINQLKDWLGYYEDLDQLNHFELNGTQNDHDYIMYLGYPVAENQNYAMIVRDVTSNRYTKMLIKAVAGNTEEVASQISAINTISKLFCEYYKISGERAALEQQIDANITMTPEEKEISKQQLRNVERDRTLYTIMMIALKETVKVVGGGIPGLMFSSLLNRITNTSNLFWEHRIGMIKGCEPINGVFSNYSEQGGCGIPLSRENMDIIGSSLGVVVGVIKNSGKYYLPNLSEENLFLDNICIGGPDEDGVAIDVTICMHGNHGPLFKVVAGSTMHVCDCTYRESDDDPLASASLMVYEKSKLIMDSGVLSHISNFGGEVVINNGRLLGGMTGWNNSKATINGGIIADDITYISGYGNADYYNGEIIINDGTVDARVSSGGSKIIVNNGKISSIYNNSGGEVIINGGQITGIEPLRTYRPGVGVINKSGSITIKSGKIHGIYNEEGTISVTGGKVTDCGKLTDFTGYANGIYNGTAGTVNITGNADIGVSKGNCIENKGTFNISNSSIKGNILNNKGMLCFVNGCLDGDIENNSGTVLVNGGTIKGGLSSHNSPGKVNINNGMIQGNVTNSNHADLVISGGTIQGKSTNEAGFTFLIKRDSIIEVHGVYGTFSINVEADTDYTGEVTCYNNPNAQGIKMTIEDARSINFKQPYVRLVAADTADGPISGQGPEAPDVSGKYKISYNANGGTGEIDSFTVEKDRPFTLPACTITAPAGKEFKAWSIDGREYAPGSTYTVTGSTTITAVWQDKTGQDDTSVFEIKASAGRNGRITPSGSVRVSKGESVKFQMIPNGGGRVERVIVDGTALDMDSMDYYTFGRVEDGSVYYLFNNVTKNHTISATFTEEYRVPNHFGSISSGNSNGPSKPSKNATASTPSSVPTTKDTPFFTDVSPDYWAKDAIDWASGNSYMSGYGDGSFKPGNPVTRQQLWMVLGRMAGANPANMAAAKDWAVNSGVSDGTNPRHDMSRQQMVTILYRYVQLMGYELTGSADLANYPDYGSVGGYAKDAMAWAVANGIIGGTSDGRLNPTGSATRAQFAVILQRFYNHVVNV